MKTTVCPRDIETYEVELDWENDTNTSIIEDSLIVNYQGVDVSMFLSAEKYNELVQEVNQWLWDRRDRSSRYNREE